MINLYKTEIKRFDAGIRIAFERQFRWFNQDEVFRKIRIIWGKQESKYYKILKKEKEH